MRRSVLKTPNYTRSDYIQDNFKSGEEPWEVRRARIARQAEAACNNNADLDAFASQYGLEFSFA